MTELATLDSPNDVLHKYQGRLASHFSTVRTERGVNEPIFAIEHGLVPDEVATLTYAVAWAVAEGRSLGTTPFPLVVVATEVGYEYHGSEYWPLLRERLPGWDPSRRESLRRAFEEFADRVGGFRPTGLWAEQFPLIAWPISHAILPQVYQEQLADVLHRLRDLSRDELTDPLVLGRVIAAHVSQSSDRFQQQAQNYEVIGRIASALLVPEGESGSSTILRETLDRITVDLSRHSEAKRQLEEVRERSRCAFLQRRAASGPEGASANQRLPRLDLRLDQTESGFQLSALLPALRPITEKNDELRDFLLQGRVSLEGRRRPVSGRSLIDGGSFIFDHSPYQGSRLVSCRSEGHQAVEELLNDVLTLPTLPLLFTFEDGIGKLVRGGNVRPGQRYAFVGPSPVDVESAGWATETGSLFDLNIRILEIPTLVDSGIEESLEQHGIALRSSARIVPVGLPSGGWDGDAYAHWVAGQEIFVRVESNRRWSNLEATFGDDIVRLPIEDEPLLSLGTPSTGAHRLDVRLSDADGHSANGVLNIQIDDLPSTGAYALGLHFDPPYPTFLEVVDGEATLAISGPRGVSATLGVKLKASDGSVLVEEVRDVVQLPLSTDEGTSLLRRLLDSPQPKKRASEAERLEVSVVARDLGQAVATAERRLVPLRWIYLEEGSAARLVDNVSHARPEIVFRSATEPIVERKIDLTDDDVYRVDGRGLLVSRIGDLTAGVVMEPSRLSSLSDLAAPDPRIERACRSSVSRMRCLVESAAAWKAAEKPLVTADLLVARVLQGIVAAIAAEICGGLWAGVEDALLLHGRWSDSKVESAIGEDNESLALLADVRRLLDPAGGDLLAIREGFKSLVQSRCPAAKADDLADFVLLIATEPSRVGHLAQNRFAEMADLLIRNPLLLRLARYIALNPDLADDGDALEPRRLVPS